MMETRHSLYLLQATQGGDPIFGMLIPMALIAAIFYFLIFRPMRKRQKDQESLIGNLKNGDRVVTSGGIYGTIAGIKDHTIQLKIADNVKIEVGKNAIAGLQPTSPEDKS
jgi:preprotein translocase subunit YajC